nr:TPA_asm: m99.5 sORF 4 [Murid betaherpesvirus 1]DBA07870.1 TPA_asm: m99.5 sORF 4 [Murid betaherpesvirus 1]
MDGRRNDRLSRKI